MTVDGHVGDISSDQDIDEQSEGLLPSLQTCQNNFDTPLQGFWQDFKSKDLERRFQRHYCKHSLKYSRMYVSVMGSYFLYLLVLNILLEKSAKKVPHVQTQSLNAQTQLLCERLWADHYTTMNVECAPGKAVAATAVGVSVLFLVLSYCTNFFVKWYQLVMFAATFCYSGLCISMIATLQHIYLKNFLAHGKLESSCILIFLLNATTVVIPVLTLRLSLRSQSVIFAVTNGANFYFASQDFPVRMGGAKNKAGVYRLSVLPIAILVAVFNILVFFMQRSNEWSARFLYWQNMRMHILQKIETLCALQERQRESFCPRAEAEEEADAIERSRVANRFRAFTLSTTQVERVESQSQDSWFSSDDEEYQVQEEKRQVAEHNPKRMFRFLPEN